AGSTGNGTLLVSKEDTLISYTGDTLRATATSASNSTTTVNLSAVIAEATDGNLGTQLAGTQLKFTLYGPNDNTFTSPISTCTGTVSATGPGTGLASCVSSPAVVANNYIIKVELLTNPYY